MNCLAPIILGGTVVLSSLPVVEERQHFHIELRQYQESSKPTYETPASTATFVTGTVGFSDHSGDKWNRNFR